MSSTTQIMTARQLAAMPNDGQRYELVRGELNMMSPAGNVHGRISMRLAWRLAQFVEENQLGAVYAAETGFLIGRDPDTVRAPDVAFVRKNQLGQADEADGYLPLAPDLVVEVVSPHDTFTRVEQKALAWLDAGSTLVVVVDPGTRTVRVYRARNNITVLYEGDILEAEGVVSGWELPVGELFA